LKFPLALQAVFLCKVYVAENFDKCPAINRENGRIMFQDSNVLALGRIKLECISHIRESVLKPSAGAAGCTSSRRAAAAEV
jgi:hypothetical protein